MNNVLRVRISAMILVVMGLFSTSLYSQIAESVDTTTTSDDLLKLSFEDLMNVRVITPTRSLQNSVQAPATVMVVTGHQIRIRGYRNLAEVLNDLPDIQVSDKSQPQFYNAVTVRGIYRQDYFVVLMDGIRISSPTNEPLPILENFPIYLARQIEVVYGPGSALYGADAMACVINIITREPGGKEDLMVTTMAGTQGYSNASGLFSKRFARGLGVSVGGQYTYDAQPDFSRIYPEAFDMTSHQTGLFNTAYGPVQVSQPVSPEFAAPVKTYNIFSAIDQGQFSMKFLHHYAQVPTSTTMKPDNAVYNKNVFYGQSVTTMSASYSSSAKKVKLISSLAGSLYRINPNSNYRNLYGGMAHGYKYGTGSMIKAEEQLIYSISKNLTVTGGLMYEIFHAIPKSPELQNPVKPQNAVGGMLLNSSTAENPEGIEAKFFPLAYTNTGAYVQSQYAPLSTLSLTTGVRFDHNSRFGLTANPRIGAVLTPVKGTTVKALFGTAFWAPSPVTSFDSYGSFYTTDNGETYQSAYWHLPNPDLKPMRSRTFEASIQQKFSRDLYFTLTGYHTQIRDIISNVSDNGHTDLYNNSFLGWPVSYIEVPYNTGTQENYGGSLNATYSFQIAKLKLHAYSSVSYLEGKLSDTEQTGVSGRIEQGVMAPWQFRLGVDGTWRAFHFSARHIQLGEQRTMSLQENAYARQTINGYSVLNVSVGYTIKNSATFFLNVQNVLDKRYTVPLDWDTSDSNTDTFASGFQDPRRIMAGLRMTFGKGRH